MQIVYQIIADGQDITAKLQDRLISLNIIDEAGQKSDSAEITIDDRDHLVELPRTGAELNISLGVGGLTEIGSYVVDEVSGEFAPSTITISAKAADMLGAIRARKTRAWRDVTIEDIIELIVGEIEDEFDVEENQTDDIRQVSKHVFMVQALTGLEQFNQYFNTQFDVEEADTIGGIVLHEFGHMPEKGEEVMINGITFKIQSADTRRIQQLTVTLPKIEEENAA